MANLSYAAAAKAYLADCRASGKTKATLDSYSRTLAAFGRYIGTDTAVSSITPADLAAWKVDTASRVSLTSLALYVTHLKSFFSFCTDMEYTPRNPATKSLSVDRKKVRQQQQKPYEKLLTESDLRTILLDNAPRDMLRSAIARNRAILALFLTSGIRNDSLCRLTVGDLLPEKNALRLINAKGGKNGLVLLSDVALQAVKAYVEATPDRDWHNSSTYLFTPPKSPDNTPYTRSAMSSLVMRAVADWTGREGQRSHSLRHSFANILLRNGMDSVDIAMLLMHSDGATPAVTWQYTGTDTTRQRKQANSIFNRIMEGLIV